MENANVKTIYHLKLTPKCSNVPWNCGSISDSSADQPFWKTDYSFRLQNIWKKGLETWCLLIQERLVLISSVHSQEAHLSYEANAPALLTEEKSLQAVHENIQSGLLLWVIIDSVSPLAKEKTERKSFASQRYFSHIPDCFSEQHCCYQSEINYFILVEPKLLNHLWKMTFSTYCHSVSMLNLLSYSFS